MDTIFDKPLNKELNDKPDYATEMPMSDSDSTSVSQAIVNLQEQTSKRIPSEPPDTNYGIVSNMFVSYDSGTWYLNLVTPSSSTWKKVALTNVT